MENQFLKNIAEAISKEGKIRFEDDFRSYNEWDSMSALSVIAMVDEKYQVIITGNDVRECKTIQDLYNIVQKRIQ